MRLRITDLNGEVVQEDAADRPIEFHGPAFRVYKTMPADEHYFGLGDKPGPLDRRNHAYSLWNTDSYGFQESTDPIYKSHPLFPDISSRDDHRRIVRQHLADKFRFRQGISATPIPLDRRTARWTITSSMGRTQSMYCPPTPGSPGQLLSRLCGLSASSNLVSPTIQSRR